MWANSEVSQNSTVPTVDFETLFRAEDCLSGQIATEMNVAWNSAPDCEDAETALTQNLEDFYEYFMARETMSLKSELMAGLKLCVGVTKRGSLVVRTRQGVKKMMATELKLYLGVNRVRFMNDEPVMESLLDFLMEAKKKTVLKLVKV
jgi:hypothetical protein